MPLIDLEQFSFSSAGTVRIRATAADPYAGLRGHAYIAARNLAQPAKRLDGRTTDQLAAVMNIQTAHCERRRQSLIAGAPIWDLNNDDSLARLHELIDVAEAQDRQVTFVSCSGGSLNYLDAGQDRRFWPVEL